MHSLRSNSSCSHTGITAMLSSSSTDIMHDDHHSPATATAIATAIAHDATDHCPAPALPSGGGVSQVFLPSEGAGGGDLHSLCLHLYTPTVLSSLPKYTL